jgi:phosphoribosylformimino-5-aminoimidazole carboxamide ribotide isomerase
MVTASGFEILAAIDLRGGRVVRLEQGDFARETTFADDPVAAALSFAAAGVRWLHVVDLDGARTGIPAHGAVIGRILAAVPTIAIEVAGGLRSEAAVDRILDAGASRAVIGTAALQDPLLAGRLVEGYGAARIAVALDVRDGLAVGHGWSSGAAGIDVERAMLDLAAVGVTTFEVTAIDRDGLLGGPDLALYERLVALDAGGVIASAGIRSTDDLVALREIGCRGAIIGRALYDGRLELGEAVTALDLSR